MNKTKYPLYSGEICGDIYDDEGKCYRLVRITQWANRTKNATEVQSKAYYFDLGKSRSVRLCLPKILSDENYCAQIFKYPQYSKLKIREEIKITQC